MRVVQFTLQVNYANVFLAIDERSGDAFLVDCGAFEEQVRSAIEGLAGRLKFLLLTHSHYDHVDGLEKFKQVWDVPVYAFDSRFGQRVREGDTIPFAGDEIAVLETPGHIDDGISFLFRDRVFVGDAIFAGAVGGTPDRRKFEIATRNVWQKILSLPDATVIYPGHGAPSLVGVERLYNPFFL